MSKSRVLILGGCGFIGRHLVKYLVDNNLAAKIRVADKSMPEISFFSEEFIKLYANPIVEFKQANLCNPGHVTRVFTDPEGSYNIVINLAAETKYGLLDEIYKEKCLDLSLLCANEAMKHGPLDRFIEVSTAQVYDADKKPSTEKDKLDPWTSLAKFKSEAEKGLQAISGLPLIILRPAIVYGPADVNGLMPRIICAVVYKELKEKMKFLWSGSLRINTVHVSDVAKAIWHVVQNGKTGDIFNLADKNDTDQGKFNSVLEKIFHIETGFAGDLMSNLAKMKMSAVVEDVNDKHLQPWSDVCKAAGIKNTPLSPYLAKELLYKNPLSVDGSKIEGTGFEYSHPYVTEELIRESVDYYVKLGVFPNTFA